MPSNAAVAVVGDITLTEAKDKLERALKDLKLGEVTAMKPEDL